MSTEHLTRKGIGRLRILSESRFVHLVHRMVEEALEQRLATVQPPREDPAPPDPGPDADDLGDTEVVILDEFVDSDTHTDTGASDAAGSGIGRNEEDPGSALHSLAARQEEWNVLRDRHLRALDSVEERLSALGDTVRDIEAVVGDAPLPDGSRVSALLEARRRERQRLLDDAFAPGASEQGDAVETRAGDALEAGPEVRMPETPAPDPERGANSETADAGDSGRTEPPSGANGPSAPAERG